MDNAESNTMKQLLGKIASLSESQLARSSGVLSMIWSGTTGPLDLPTQEPESGLSVNSAEVANLHRVELALLKSISTGASIDVQFYVYNAISDDLPLGPKPLFASSIAIEGWGSAIATRKFEGFFPFVSS